VCNCDCILNNLPLPERKLIERIRRRAGPVRTKGLVAGIGDDAAILELPRNRQLVATTDLMVEGVHFRRDWHSPESIGHRALARGLSDLAAMGADPWAVLLSLALAPRTPQAWVDKFLTAFLKLARKHDVALIGGDTSASGAQITADVVMLGKVPRGKAVLRSGARPGDVICVTGELGAASAAIRELRRRGQRGTGRRELAPQPRLEVGRWLRERRLATAMIDLSDGLSTDLLHICQQSRVGAAILESAVPRPATATIEDALHGGEDYELLFTIPRQKRLPSEIEGVPVSAIGEIVASRRPAARILAKGRWRPLAPHGWQHFA